MNKIGKGYSSDKDDWIKIWKNIETIALKILYQKLMEFSSAYISKHSSNAKKQCIILMISNGESWHYLVVKRTCTVRSIVKAPQWISDLFLIF